MALLGTSLENKSIVQTIIDSARDPDKVLEFNFASEALNNSFFLESLVRHVFLCYFLSRPVSASSRRRHSCKSDIVPSF